MLEQADLKKRIDKEEYDRRKKNSPRSSCVYSSSAFARSSPSSYALTDGRIGQGHEHLSSS